MPRQKASACIHCRQMKLRCDSRERFPASCSRCLRQGLRCSVDPAFKRTAKRQRIEAIEKELQEIKANMEVPSQTSPNRANGDVASPRHVLPQPAAPPSGTPELTPSSILQDPSWIFETQRIDDIEIQPSVIAELLERYYSIYHPIFPILPDLASFVRTYDSCPLLFWTIISISSKHVPEHSYLHQVLETPVQRLATDMNAVSSMSFPTVQALLLLCWWPFPFRAVIQDPSWTYCGMAVHIALSFGLHRPKHHDDFFYRIKLDEEQLTLQQKTWLACFITNDFLSNLLGVPPTVQIDHAVLSVIDSNPSWLPPVLYHYLQISYQNYQLCRALGDNPLTSSGLLPNPLHLITMFETNLRRLELSIGDQLSPFAEIAFLHSKLQLYSFACASVVSESQRISSQASEMMLQAATTAMSLIQIACTAPQGFRYATAAVRHSIVYAVLFLLKLLSSPESHAMDEAAARNSISQAFDLFKEHSELPNDHLSRICAIIEYLSRQTQLSPRRKDGMTMVVKSRRSSNLLFDCAWRAKERFSQEIRDAKPLDYTTAAEQESLYQMGIDLHLDPPYLEGWLNGWDFNFPETLGVLGTS